MIGTGPALLFDALPWWIATPVLQLTLLVTGMALDETYVNRATVLAGALALYVHSVVTGGLWFPVGLYLDVGLVVGAFGLYAYVVDAYVPNWFRVLAFFVYSPVSIFLVIVLPDVIFFVALAIAAYANLQLLAYFDPVEPYYFGPGSPDAYEAVAAETGAPEPVVGDRSASDESQGTGSAGRQLGSAGGPTEPGSSGVASPTQAPVAGSGAAADAGSGEPTERGILPEFMRRL